MNFIDKLLSLTRLTFLAEPIADDEVERQDVIEWINQYLLSVLESIEADIESKKESVGLLPQDTSDDNTESSSQNNISYVIKNKAGARLILSQFSLVSCNSIKMTENYQQLKTFTDNHGYTLLLKEVNVDTKGMETDKKLGDYLDDFDRYLRITISGW